MPLTVMAPCSLDITCYPPQPTPVPQVVGARWQQIESVRLIFRSDRMAEILRAPPIPWRANLDDFCYVDEVRFVHYPYLFRSPRTSRSQERLRRAAVTIVIPARFVASLRRSAGLHTSVQSCSGGSATGRASTSGKFYLPSRVETASGSRACRALTLLLLSASIR